MRFTALRSALLDAHGQGGVDGELGLFAQNTSVFSPSVRLSDEEFQREYLKKAAAYQKNDKDNKTTNMTNPQQIQQIQRTYVSADRSRSSAAVRARLCPRASVASCADSRDHTMQCAEWDDHYVNTKYFFQRSSIPTNSALYAARAEGSRDSRARLMNEPHQRTHLPAHWS